MGSSIYRTQAVAEAAIRVQAWETTAHVNMYAVGGHYSQYLRLQANSSPPMGRQCDCSVASYN